MQKTFQIGDRVMVHFSNHTSFHGVMDSSLEQNGYGAYVKLGDRIIFATADRIEKDYTAVR